MTYTKLLTAALAVLSLLYASAPSADNQYFQEADVVIFTDVGPYGGGVLTPFTVYEPGPGAKAWLRRSNHCLSYRLKTDNLPQGAYTNWYGIINQPQNCEFPDCSGPNDFGPATEATVFWATGGIVGEDGEGHFQDRVCVGDDFGFPAGPGTQMARCAAPVFPFPVEDAPDAKCELTGVSGTQHLAGPGLTNPKGAFVSIVVKYHGLVSEDPVVLYDQTHTLLGSCFEGANAIDFPGLGLQCPDPQIANFPPPAE